MNIDEKKFYGSTTVGEKGQVVLPAELRRDFNIKTGDKIVVMVMKRKGVSGIIMLEANIFANVIDTFFGGKLEEFIEDKFPPGKTK